MGQPGGDARKVPHAVSVGVEEAARIDLVDGRTLPPWRGPAARATAFLRACASSCHAPFLRLVPAWPKAGGHGKARAWALHGAAFAGDGAAVDETLDLLRMADRERWLALLWAPPASRAALAAVLAYDCELERVVASLTEPLLAELRLAWWRERLAELARGERPPAQPLLRALAADARGAGVDLVALERLEDSLLPLLGDGEPDLALIAAQRGAALAAALAPLVGDGAGPALARIAMARFARRDWRAAGPIARGLAAWRASPPASFEAAGPAPPRLLVGLDALARADLAALRAGRPLAPAAGPGRQLRLAVAALGLSPRARTC